MPAAETKGPATAPSAAVPRNPRREMLIPPPSRKLSRFTEQVQHDTPPVRPRAVFEDINALPRPEGHTSVFHRDGELCQGQCGADMCRHVVRAFDGMAIEPIVLGHEAIEE